MGFLPEGYKEPTSDKYMRIKDGENTFRILSSAIIGYEYWVSGTNEEGKEVRKPIRKHLNETIPQSDLGIDKYGRAEYPKVFWAFIVYSWDDDAIQILNLTQKSIRNEIKAIIDNKKWGDPKEYNMVISKEGQDLETRYRVNPEPKEKLPQEVINKFNATTINLEALYEGGDPFATEESKEEIDISEIEV